MTESESNFTDLVEQAISHSLLNFEALHLGTLAGFALGVDDDLMTIFDVCSDRSFFEKPPYPEAAYLFVEWPFAGRSGAFDAVKAEMRERFNAAETAGYNENIEAHVVSTFGCLVEALRRTRQAGRLKAEVLLIVGSTDPSDFSVSLMLKAVKLLNTPQLYQAFIKAQGRLPDGVNP